MVLGSIYPLEMQAQWGGMILLAAADDDEDEDDDDDDSGGGSSYSSHYSSPSYYSHSYTPSYRSYRARPSHRARPRHARRAAYTHHRSASRHYTPRHHAQARQASRKHATPHSRRKTYTRRHHPAHTTSASIRSRHHAALRHQRTLHRASRPTPKAERRALKQTRRHQASVHQASARSRHQASQRSVRHHPQASRPSHQKKEANRRRHHAAASHQVSRNRVRSVRQPAKIRRHESHEIKRRLSSKQIRTSHEHGKAVTRSQIKLSPKKFRRKPAHHALAGTNQRQGRQELRKATKKQAIAAPKSKIHTSKGRDAFHPPSAKASRKLQQKAPSVKRMVTPSVSNETRSVAGKRKAATKMAPRLTRKEVVKNQRPPAVKTTKTTPRRKR